VPMQQLSCLSEVTHVTRFLWPALSHKELLPVESEVEFILYFVANPSLSLNMFLSPFSKYVLILPLKPFSDLFCTQLKQQCRLFS